MPQAMKHYKLTHQEWIAVATSLPRREMVVLFYVKTLEPSPGRTLALDIQEMAEVLDMHTDTLRRCLRVLKSKGWLDINTRTLVVKDCFYQPDERALVNL